MANQLFIGTSGFSYKDWIEKFYPEDLPSNIWLEYYADQFKTVEINNSFYRLPSLATWRNWFKRTPEGFLFSVKAHQGVSHLKKLIVPNEYWENFLKRVRLLKEKLGVILIQLPPQLKADPERLSQFLDRYQQNNLRLAFEFRHQSWFEEPILEILEKFNASLVFHDCKDWPIPPKKTTADFVYLRLHGIEQKYNYRYSEEELKEWVSEINQWQKKQLDVFVYFNNDVDAFAVSNAKELINLTNS